FDSALVGSGKQVVPIIMYPSAHYFFVTYHTTAVIVLRRVRTSPLGRHPLAVALAVAAAAWFWAWAEIRLTTEPSIADQFRYEDMAWALRWGAVFYACYFIVSFPMVYRLDEEPAARWTLGRTAIDALAAGMLVFTLLDLVTRFVTGAPWGRCSGRATRARSTRRTPSRRPGSGRSRSRTASSRRRRSKG